ncbi:MAG: universal stress protein, partial [Deltaproteobacteria bacterium]|nr:universal stress protein [Deltaproteobacteria bacterium]
MFEKILFPVDFSLHSDTIMKCVPELKKAGMEKAVFVHAIDPTEASQWANVEEAIATRGKEAEGKMADFISKKMSPLGIAGTYRTGVGLPHHVILKIAEEEQASLIVMGSHGHSYMKGAVLGSVTHKVATLTRVPLLIAKIQSFEGEGEQRVACMKLKDLFRKILYPTDFSSYAQTVLQVITDLKMTEIDAVVVVHIQDTRKLLPYLQHMMGKFNEIDSERLSEIERKLHVAGYKVITILKEGVPFVEVNRIAEEEDVSLIMLASQGKGYIREALMGSVSE